MSIKKKNFSLEKLTRDSVWLARFGLLGRTDWLPWSALPVALC